MTTYTTYPLVVSATSTNVTSGGVSAVGVTLDGLASVLIPKATNTAGGLTDGVEWFEASVALPAGVAWFSLEGSSATDITNRWQFEFMRIDATDGSVHEVQPRRLTHRYTDGTQTEFFLPRMSFDTHGDSIDYTEDTYGGPLTLRVRISVENIATDAADLGGGPDLGFLALVARTGVPPTRDADWLRTGAEWDPGIDIHPFRDPTGIDWHPARALHVQLTDQTAGTTESHMHPPEDGVLRFRANRILHPGSTYLFEATALFERFGQVQVQDIDSATLVMGSAANAATFTVVASGTYGVQVDYSSASSSVERTGDSGATWQQVVTGSFDSTAIVGYIDRPPLNTTLTYRAWHGAKVLDGGPGYALTDGEAAVATSAFDSGAVAAFKTSATISVAATTWVMNAGSAEIEIPAREVSVRKKSTVGLTYRADGSSQLVPGEITDPTYTILFTLTSTDDESALAAALESNQILLRGPHGEREWVQPIGEISSRQVPVLETGLDRGSFGALAQTAFVTQMTVRFVKDSQWAY